MIAIRMNVLCSPHVERLRHFSNSLYLFEL